MTILVIGAGGTIGRACLEELQGTDQLVAIDIKTPEFSKAKCLPLDVTDSKAVESQLKALDTEDEIKGLIYAAGLNTTGSIDAIDWQDYEKVMAVNLRGAFHIGAACLSIIRKSPRIFNSVFISSTAGLVGESGGSIYSASKFGLIGFAQAFAGELALFKGRANVVSPGNVNSPMLTELASRIGQREGKSQEEMLNRWQNGSSFKRLIEPAEVAKTCAWLLSKDASGINGQVIVVDGLPA